jgi:phosphoribosylformimino-5-aminoimidazole carboxamide ribotide isomerase
VLILPAIDIRGGRVASGDVVYQADPVAQAEAFLAQGAHWLHVVDLDRAFGTGGDNTALIRRIAALPGAAVQVGGLLRTAEQAGAALETGAARAVVATEVALDDARLDEVVARCGAAALGAALDVRQGSLALRGVRRPAGRTASEVAAGAVRRGIRTLLYRDLDRDGALTGLDVAGAATLRAAVPPADIIVAGGGASLAELSAARAAGLAGVIIGRALYERRFTLGDAIACCG